MSMTTLPRIAARNLVRHARHSMFALAAVVFGVTGLELAEGFINDVFHQLGEATVRAQLGHIQISRPGFSGSGAGRPEDFVIERPQALAGALAGDERIESVAGRLSFSALLDADGRQVPVVVEGVDLKGLSGAGTYIRLLDGAGLAESGPSAALLGEGVARQLSVRAGDYVFLTAPTLDGALNAAELGVAGVFRSYSKDFDDRAVRVALAEAQDFLQTSGVNALVLSLRRTEDTSALLVELRERPELGSFELMPWYELSDFYSSTRELYARQFGILQGIALVLIAMSVLTSTNITVFERTAEFGTMRALGTRSREVTSLIVLESAMLGAAGAAIGVVIALALGELISWLGIPMPPPPNAEEGFVARVLITHSALAWAAGVGISSSILGALLPAHRVGRMPIVTSLGRRI